MSEVNVEPNATTQLGDSVISGGAPNAHTALSDDSETTYLSLGTPNPTVVEFPDPTITAGAVCTAIQVRIASRASAFGGPSGRIILSLDADTRIGQTDETWNTLNGFFDPTGIVVTEFPTIGNLIAENPTGLTLSLAGADGMGVALAYEAEINVKFVAQPSVEAVVVGPGDPITETNRPLIEWVMVLDGPGAFIPANTLPMTAFEVKVFHEDVYSAPGFDVDDSEPSADWSDVVTEDLHQTLTIVGYTSNWRSNASLENGIYKAYVRVAQSVWGTANFWSDWEASDAFEILCDLPHTPILEVGADDDDGRIGIHLEEGSGADLSSDFIVVERSLDFGETWETIRTDAGDGVVLEADYD